MISAIFIYEVYKYTINNSLTNLSKFKLYIGISLCHYARYGLVFKNSYIISVAL